MEPEEEESTAVPMGLVSRETVSRTLLRALRNSWADKKRSPRFTVRAFITTSESTLGVAEFFR